MTSNLPNWPGADVAYRHAAMWTRVQAAADYRAWLSGKRKYKFAVSEDVADCISAMNTGDEETIKSLNLRHIAQWAQS